VCGGRMSCTGGENGAEFVRERNRFCIYVARSLQQSSPSSLCSSGAHTYYYIRRVHAFYIRAYRYIGMTGIYLYNIILELYNTLRIYIYIYIYTHIIMCRLMLATCVCNVCVYIRYTTNFTLRGEISRVQGGAFVHYNIICCVMCIRTSTVVR